MKMNLQISTILLLLTITLLNASTVSASEFYIHFTFEYDDAPVDTMLINGNVCNDTSCSTLGEALDVFSGNAMECWTSYQAAPDTFDFVSCMDSHRVSDNIVSTDSAFVKLDSIDVLGALVFFSPEGDVYVPMFADLAGFNCDYDICVNDWENRLSFGKKDGVAAQVSQLRLDNGKITPLQVGEHVSVQFTLCSAYLNTLERDFPSIYGNYADFQSDISASISVVSENDENVYTGSIILPIEAGACATLTNVASFQLPAFLSGQRITLTVETEVVDGQVSTSETRKASSTRTVH